jgi:hypothetical protein
MQLPNRKGCMKRKERVPRDERIWIDTLHGEYFCQTVHTALDKRVDSPNCARGSR